MASPAPHNTSHPPEPAEVQTFFFADLCGFTQYTQNNGDLRAAQLAVGFHRRVRALAAEEGCSVVKSIGDAVMVRACDCHRAMRLAARVLALGGLGDHPPVRIGLDTGPAVQHDGDWYGSTVNAAARVTAAAAPGELLLTEHARRALGEARSFELARRGPRPLKGLPASYLHAAVPAPARSLPERACATAA